VRGNQRVTSGRPGSDLRGAREVRARSARSWPPPGKLDPVIGRDEEVRRVVQVLSRRTKNNPVLIGEPGVGKTAIVEGSRSASSTGDVPERLRDKRHHHARHGRADRRRQVPRRVRGAPEGRAEGGTVVGGQIILFIDELHTVVGAGAPRARWTPPTC
jgi:ATP-dependent Clp protease ATP-binding subunit ClpB